MKNNNSHQLSRRQVEQGDRQLVIKGSDTLGHYMTHSTPQQHITVNAFLALLKKLNFFK